MQYLGKVSKVLSVPVTNRVPFWCTSGALCYCFGALLKRVTQVQHSQSYMVLCLLLLLSQWSDFKINNKNNIMMQAISKSKSISITE